MRVDDGIEFISLGYRQFNFQYDTEDGAEGQINLKLPCPIHEQTVLLCSVDPQPPARDYAIIQPLATKADTNKTSIKAI